MRPARKIDRRRRNFVDSQVQGALLRQAIWYWLATTVLYALLILIYRVAPAWLSGNVRDSGQLWHHFAPYLLASAALFPLFIASANRFSNRFAGPMLRIRRTLKQLADGESPPYLLLREGDFWSDAAKDINLIAARLGRGQRAMPVEPIPEDDVEEASSIADAEAPVGLPR